MKSEEEIKKVKQKCDLLENNLKLMEMRMENLFQENKFLTDQLEIATWNMAKQGSILSILSIMEEQKQGINATIEKIENLEQRFDCRCDQIEKKQEQLETIIDKITHKDPTLTPESKQIENAVKVLEPRVIHTEDDEFLWCIKNLDEKVKQAKHGTGTELFSFPFYSHDNGYKICLKLFLNGTGYGKGTHWSLFVCIMRGPADGRLSWPFRHDFKLELLNQETGLAHISTNWGYGACASEAWDKPTSDINAGCGPYHFINPSELLSNAALIQGDQILIRATLQIKP